MECVKVGKSDCGRRGRGGVGRGGGVIVGRRGRGGVCRGGGE